MKKTQKKVIGGLIVVILLATIGAAVFADAQTNRSNQSSIPQKPYWGRRPINQLAPFAYNLTQAQQSELQTLITTLKNQNATPQQIRAAVQQKLDEYGVFDTQLNNQINRTEQILKILNREKELRTEGYNWSQIQQTIQNEFNTTSLGCTNQTMLFHFGFGRRSYTDSHGFIPNDQSCKNMTFRPKNHWK